MRVHVCPMCQRPLRERVGAYHGPALSFCRCREEGLGLAEGYIIEDFSGAPVGHWNSYRNEHGVLCFSYSHDAETVEDVYELLSEAPNGRVTCAYCGKRSRAGLSVAGAEKWFVSHECVGDVAYGEFGGEATVGDARRLPRSPVSPPLERSA